MVSSTHRDREVELTLVCWHQGFILIFLIEKGAILRLEYPPLGQPLQGSACEAGDGPCAGATASLRRLWKVLRVPGLNPGFSPLFGAYSQVGNVWNTETHVFPMEKTVKQATLGVPNFRTYSCWIGVVRVCFLVYRHDCWSSRVSWAMRSPHGFKLDHSKWPGESIIPIHS